MHERVFFVGVLNPPYTMSLWRAIDKKATAKLIDNVDGCREHLIRTSLFRRDHRQVREEVD